MKKQISFPIALIIIIACALIVIFAVYIYSLMPKVEERPIIETKIETDGWEVYRNETLGFEMKYPSKWEIDYGYYSDIRFSKVLGEGEKEEIMIIFVEPTTNEEIADFYIISKEEITINEITWKKVYEAEQSTIPEIVAFITERNNEFFIVSFNLLLESEENIQNIISTFKFEEIEILEDFNDWENYKNEEYGFEIKYHKNWQVAKEDDMVFFLKKFPGDFLEKVELSQLFGSSPEVFIMGIILDDSYIEELIEDIDYDYNIISKEKISINSVQGYKIHIAEVSYFPESFIYLIPRGDKTLIVFIFDLDFAEDIISSFNILD